MAGYTCHSCSFNGTLVQVVEHRKEHVSNRRDATFCCICSGRVRSFLLRRHIRSRHPNDCTAHCHICRDPFVEDADMRNHVNSGCRKSPGKAMPSYVIGMTEPKNRGPYKCDVCPDSFATEQGMRHHRKAKHGSSGPSFGGGYYFTSHTSTSYKAEPSTSSDSESDDDTDSESSSDMKDFLDRCEPADVHRYISDHLQPDESYREECSSVVEHLANFFKRHSVFTVNRFIKGGSLGKGTAIKSTSDVDLVMFISELPPIGNKNYKEKLREQLDELENTLQRSKHSIAYKLSVVGRTNYAVKLRVQSKKADREPHDVDLLLASDLLGPVPTDVKKEEVYRKMGNMSSSARQYCSAALVKLQLDFVKDQCAVEPGLEDLIRLVKMWKASCVTETSLTSYPLELICIQTYPYYGTVTAAFKAVLQKLRDYSSICAYWTHNYSNSRVQAMLGERPLILDPANPYNNVADRCRDWSAVARAAQQTLKKPFFSRC